MNTSTGFEDWPSPPPPAVTEPLKTPGMSAGVLLKALDELERDQRLKSAVESQAMQPTIRSQTLIRPETFEARRAGEKKWFTKRRQKNRAANKAARKARKR